MVCAFVKLALLWPLSFPKELMGPLSSATTNARCPETGYLVRILSHCVPLRHVSYVLFERPSLICLCRFSLHHPQTHSATTLAYESTTHANTTGSTHAANGGADYAPTITLWQIQYRVFQRRVESTSHRRLRCTLARTCARRWCRC